MQLAEACCWGEDGLMVVVMLLGNTKLSPGTVLSPLQIGDLPTFYRFREVHTANRWLRQDLNPSRPVSRVHNSVLSRVRVWRAAYTLWGSRSLCLRYGKAAWRRGWMCELELKAAQRFCGHLLCAFAREGCSWGFKEGFSEEVPLGL